MEEKHMNAQWGTFTQQHGLPFNDTLNTAQASLQRHGYQIFNSTATNEGMVMGGLGDVIVQVTCRPLNDGRTYVIVSAFSEDASAAEQARNLIREWSEYEQVPPLRGTSFFSPSVSSVVMINI